MALLAVVGLVTWLAVAPGDGGTSRDEPYTVELPSSGAAATTPDDGLPAAGAAQALERLAAALADHDESAAALLAGAGEERVRRRLAELVGNVEAAHIVGVGFRYVDEAGPVDADGAWSAAVETTWRYARFDRVSSATEVRFRFVPEAAGGTEVAIAGIGGGSALRTPVWLSGPLAVSRSEDLMVLAVGRPSRPADLTPYVTVAGEAVPEVSDVLPRWRARLVLEVPRGTAPLERALGVGTGAYGQIAAVTGTADGSIAPDAPIHVYVNPSVFDGLGPIGQEVVLAHETTHVATGAPLSRAPTWLVEGFADFVALRETTLPLTQTAGQIAEQVRADGPPDALPGTSEFDTRGPHLGAVYESAWLVCVTLADRGGEDALVRFYNTVSDGAPVAPALRRGFDWSAGDLLDAWQERLVGLPGT